MNTNSLFRSFLSIFESDSESVDIPKSLIDDMDTIKDHLNKMVLKPYGVKIEAFTYSAEANDLIRFSGTPFVGKLLGVFGAVISQAYISIRIKVDEGNIANGDVALTWDYAIGDKIGSTLIGRYLFRDGKIYFADLGDNGEPNEEGAEEIGESGFSSEKAGIDVHADVDDATESEMDAEDAEEDDMKF